MNRRLLIILVCALVVAAGASYLVYRMVGTRLNARMLPQTSRIVMAARNLEIGTLIKDADLNLGEVVGPVPKGAILKKETAIGRGVVSNVYEGEPLMESRLASAGSGAGLAATIPPGMRACAVRVNDVVGVAGFVTPGMRVDVLISGNPPGGNASSGPKVKTLLQNIEVLSAGANIQKDAEGKPVQVPVVNLLVTPEQAEILSLASNETRIQLVLRNPLDKELGKTPGTIMSTLFADTGKPVPVRSDGPRRPRPIVPSPTPLAVKPPVSPYSIEVLNGAKRTETKFKRLDGETQ